MSLTLASQSQLTGSSGHTRVPFGTHSPLFVGLAIVAALALLFQVGHFAEHAFQFAVWVLGDWSNICGRDTPWMSPWVTEMVRQTGRVLFPAADPARAMMLGMETLHLVGNTIFLIGLGAMYYCTKSKWVWWGLCIEAFHLYEHVMLTSSAFFVGKPIGMSTLFGGSLLGPREFAVGFRVTWHFLMNLLPLPFAMVGLMVALTRQPRLSARNDLKNASLRV